MTHRKGEPFFFPKTSNFITKIITHGCARPFYIYLETAIPAAVEFAYMVTLLDLNDLIRARGEQLVRDKPKGLRRGKRHLRKRLFVAKDSPTKTLFRQGLKYLLIVTKPIELAGFVWLVYSAIDQFFFRWQTLLEKSTFCEQPIESGPFMRHRVGGRVNIHPAGQAILLGTLDQNRANWPNNAAVVTLPQGFFTAVFGITVTGPQGGITGVKCRLRIMHFFGTSLLESGEEDIAAGAEASFIAGGDFFLFGVTGGLLSWELVGPAVPVGLASSGGYMFVHRTG
jgi:hypothetical protein